MRKTDKYRLKEGRGKGVGVNYKPWLKVHEFGSKGRCHRILGWKQNRIYQLMSDLELYYFLLIQWEDNVIDIMEQYPMLPIECTLLIADEFNISHPPINKKEIENKTVMTTDFLITIKNNRVVKQIARTIKPVDELQKTRTLEKLVIEQEYWKRKNIDWGIITNEQISKIKAQNIYYIYNDYFWDSQNGYSIKEVERHIYNFKDILFRNDFDVCKTIRDFELFNNWLEGAGLNFFKFLLANKKIHTDFNIKFDFLNMKVWID